MGKGGEGCCKGDENVATGKRESCDTIMTKNCNRLSSLKGIDPNMT